MEHRMNKRREREPLKRACPEPLTLQRSCVTCSSLAGVQRGRCPRAVVFLLSRRVALWCSFCCCLSLPSRFLRQLFLYCRPPAIEGTSLFVAGECYRCFPGRVQYKHAGSGCFPRYLLPLSVCSCKRLGHGFSILSKRVLFVVRFFCMNIE